MDYQEAIEDLRKSNTTESAVMAMAWAIANETRGLEPTGIDITLANRAYHALNSAGFRVVKL